ncbi:glutathione reductase-like protein [Pseudovirgaria hyperparasitica]|uniref:Glutathione reductase n=1 Tax=Pseudovirgaria hyperparasitica TaxID=470096 RepID=A0A6A6WCE8_9PEZI|nr:glutathione reductase-like protein [Pseudovirgaria hyperparasitica]KAF2759724.1 glutathione reductase-like protein [Pseudovirgaria hyperparasitica]
MAPVPKECDYLVIGGGSGGLASARRASSKHGAKVIAVEHQRLGGTCVNVGCVPKKVTWNAASIAETIKEAKAYGFSVKETAPFDWPGFVKKRAAYVERLNGIYAKNLDKDKVELLRGRARFLNKHEVQVTMNDGSEVNVKAKKVLIAVGGYPTLPPIPGAKEHAITSDGFFELTQQPKKIAVVGAGYIGVEMAGMLHALGSEVHFFIRHDTFLRTFDPLIQEKVTEEYIRQGMHLHKRSSITKIEDAGNGQKKITVDLNGKEETMEVDTVLFAIGRKPEVDSLGIDKIGLEVDDKSHIKVDKYQNTNVENIYALGDACNAGFELTPVAIAAGRKLAGRLFGGLNDAHLVYENIPSVVFAHPEVGSIGLTEPQAREKYGDTIKIYQTSFTAMYYSMMEQEDKGPTAYKIICEGPNERIVGLHILGLGSGEILQGFGVAIKMGATKQDFDNCVAIHPVSAEELVTMT